MTRRKAAIAARFYEILLHFYPSEFRQAYGDAMTCVFEESLRDAYVRSGNAGVLVLWLHILADLAITALAERISCFIDNLGIEQRGSIGASLAIHTAVLFAIIWMGLHAGLHDHPPASPACGNERVTHPLSAPRSPDAISPVTVSNLSRFRQQESEVRK